MNDLTTTPETVTDVATSTRRTLTSPALRQNLKFLREAAEYEAASGRERLSLYAAERVMVADLLETDPAIVARWPAARALMEALVERTTLHLAGHFDRND